MECGDNDRGCDMTDKRRKALNHIKSRVEPWAAEEAEKVFNELDEVKQKLVDLALSYGKHLKGD